MGLAAEYGKDQIRVNSICPLLSGTGLFESFVGVPYSEENIKQFVSAVSMLFFLGLKNLSINMYDRYH